MSKTSKKVSSGQGKKTFKQGNLFSFFSKKPAAATKISAQTKNETSKAKAKANAKTKVTANTTHNKHTTPTPTSTLTLTPTSTPTTPTTSPNASPSPSPSRSPSTIPTDRLNSKGSSAVSDSDASPVSKKGRKDESLVSQNPLHVGMRLEIYWPDDATYYSGTVKSVRKNTSTISVEYDDGEFETLNLSSEKWRPLKTKAKTKAKADDLPTTKKRRAILLKNDQDDGDDQVEEAEFDDEDSEGSAYDDNGQDVQDDDDEEAADWMVTDDEDDQEVVQPPKKRLRKGSSKPVLVTKYQPKNTTTTKSFSNKNTNTNTTTTSTRATTPISRPTPRTVTPSSTSKQIPTAPQVPTGQPRAYIHGVVNPAGAHVHNHLKFLQNPKDMRNHPRDHPEYEAHTLRIDLGELEKHQKVTNAVRQWWELKSQYFDTVLLFKTGKFYEMFHMDADVGVKVLNLTYMKGHNAHAGFPEVGYGKNAERLVQAGFKVARVEQTETPQQLAMRKTKTKKGQKKPQVVNREVCSILTSGTRTHCFLDQQVLEGQIGSNSGPLLAIKEIILDSHIGEENDDDEVRPVCEYGITIVDAARAEITIGQFADDSLRSRMNTLLTAFSPSEVLVEGGEDGMSQTLHSLIRATQSTSHNPPRIETIQKVVSSPQSTAIDPEIRRKMERKSSTAKPWDIKETLDEIHRRGYFPRSSKQDKSFTTKRWPPILHAAVEGGATLALSSFGAVLFYLQRNLIDQELLSMGNVKAYIPPSSAETPNVDAMDDIAEQQSQYLDPVPPMTPTASGETDLDINGPLESPEESSINHMALDGTTLQNLEVLSNSSNYKAEGSLWSKINYTKTPHGSRMLRAWLLRPLFRKSDIERRAEAVEELLSGSASVATAEARSILAKCGDIERLVSRIHSMSGGNNIGGASVHPSERAVLYEQGIYTKRKVGDFQKVLNGLRNATQIPDLFDGIEIKSGLVKKIVYSVDKGGCFPLMQEELDWFFNNFDCEKAARGEFEPSRGVDEDYDDACDRIDDIKRELDEYKEEMCADVLRGSSRTSWKYINIKEESKDKYLIELPAHIRVPNNFIVKAKRGKGAKQVNKYRTQFVEERVGELERAISVMKEGKARGIQLVFAKFDSKRNLWEAAAQTTAMLDALASLAQASSKPGHVRPTILNCPLGAKPSINIVQGRHPCVDITHNGGEFVPNDLQLGQVKDSQEDSARVLLLSGPNMGGKSTLLRQTCLIAILAQIGCFVPADECALTPIDRIFTRLGASDRILLGQSTFFVELAECASALRGATRRSMVIMDELGRGTSTFDGTAIASACVKHLVEENQCLTLFATHYHSLLYNWESERTVRLGHMQCHVENGIGEVQDNEDKADREHNITFLYTLGDGPCPKSFGINVAKLAGLPDEVLQRAQKKSSSFEKEINEKRPTEQARELLDALEGKNYESCFKLWESMANL